jgi:hypothetical protein
VIAARVEEVLTMRLNGAELYDLVQHAREQQWDVSTRQIQRYIRQADELLAESLDMDRERSLRLHVATRRSLLARALNDGDTRTALAIVKDAAELAGLYPPRRTELSGPKGGPVEVEMTSDEKRAAISAIMARYGLTPGSGGSTATDRPGKSDPSGSVLARPDASPDESGSDAGPVANELGPLDLFPSPAADVPPGGQEHGDGSPGDGDSDSGGRLIDPFTIAELAAKRRNIP